MFDRTQIDPRVQKQLFRKINNINRQKQTKTETKQKTKQ